MKANKPTPEQENIGYQILSFYSKKNQGDHQATNKELNRLNIRDILVKENVVEIHLGSPGLLIGRKGENIDNLKAHLGKEIKMVETFVWSDILVSYDPTECYY